MLLQRLPFFFDQPSWFLELTHCRHKNTLKCAWIYQLSKVLGQQLTLIIKPGWKKDVSLIVTIAYLLITTRELRPIPGSLNPAMASVKARMTKARYQYIHRGSHFCQKCLGICFSFARYYRMSRCVTKHNIFHFSQFILTRNRAIPEVRYHFLWRVPGSAPEVRYHFFYKFADIFHRYWQFSKCEIRML